MNESKTEAQRLAHRSSHLRAAPRRVRLAIGSGLLLLCAPLAGHAAEPAPLPAPPANAQEIRDEVARLNSQGIELYKNKQYAQAVDKLAAAYRLDPDPSIVCNLARAQYKLAPGQQAAEYLERCLATDNTLTETSRQTLEGYLKDARARIVEIEPPPAPLLEVPTLPPAAPHRPLWRLGLGGSLTVLGAGLVVGGAYAWSIDGQCATPDPPCERIYKTTASGVSAVAIGSAAIVGGVILLALPARRATPPTALRRTLGGLSPGGSASP